MSAGRKVKDSRVKKSRAYPRVYSRVSVRERLQIKHDADAQGLSVSSYLRRLAITHPETRPVRRPLADLAALAHLRGQVGRIGGNLHQLLRQVNRGELPDMQELAAAAEETRRFLVAANDALKRG
jgi:hypothetical protein